MPKENIERIERLTELDDWILSRKSKNRREIETVLERMGILDQDRFNVIDLDSGERHIFDDYIQAIEFISGKKGRWYLAAPSIGHNSRKE